MGRNGSRRRKAAGKEEGEGGESRNRRWGRAFVPPPSCSFISEASEMVCTPHTSSFGLPDVNEAVCIPHTILFDLPDTSEVVCIPHTISLDLPNPNEVVCIPHTVSFGLPDANEPCASHTLLCSSVFIPPYHLGGIFYQQQSGGVMDITLPRFHFIQPPNAGGFFLFLQHR